MTPSATPRHVEGLEVNRVADGVVVFASDTQQVHYLNNTAAFVFELCDGSHDAAAIAATAANMFGAGDWPTMVAACVDDLAQRGLVH